MTDPHDPTQPPPPAPGPTADESAVPQRPGDSAPPAPADESIMPVGFDPGDSIPPTPAVHESWPTHVPLPPDDSAPPKGVGDFVDSIPPGRLASTPVTVFDDADEGGLVDFNATAGAEEGGSSAMPMPDPTPSGTAWADIRAAAAEDFRRPPSFPEADGPATGLSDKDLLADGGTDSAWPAPDDGPLPYGDPDAPPRPASVPGADAGSAIDFDALPGDANDDPLAPGRPASTVPDDSFALLIPPGERPVDGDDDIFGSAGPDTGDTADDVLGRPAPGGEDVLGVIGSDAPSMSGSEGAFSPTSGVFSLDDLEREDAASVLGTTEPVRPGSRPSMSPPSVSPPTLPAPTRAANDDDDDAFSPHPQKPGEDVLDPLADLPLSPADLVPAAPHDQAPLPEGVDDPWRQSSAVNLLEDGGNKGDSLELISPSGDAVFARQEMVTADDDSPVLTDDDMRKPDRPSTPHRGRDFDYQDSGRVDLTDVSDADIGLGITGIEPAAPPAARERTPPRPYPVPAAAGASAAPWLGGGAVGLLAGAGGTAALWFAGVLPNGSAPATTQAPVAVVPAPVEPKGGAPKAGTKPERAAEEVHKEFLAALQTGDVAAAGRLFAEVPPPLKSKELNLAFSGIRSGVETLKRFQAAGKADPADNDLKQAVADLEAAGTPTALIWKGVLEDAAGDAAAARKTYEEAAKKHPEQKRVFEAALDRLDVLGKPAAKGPDEARRPGDPRLGLELFLTLLQAEEPAAAAEPEEAGFDFWRAVKKARAGQFDEAIKLLRQARKAHDLRRLVVRRGLNPQSDPLEQIFLVSADELEAYWKLRAQKSPATPGGDQMLADLGKKLGLEKADVTAVAKAVDAVVAEGKKAADDAKAAKADAKKAAADLTTAQAEAKKAADELATAKADAEKAVADAKKAQAEVAKMTKDAEKLAADLKSSGESMKNLQAQIDAAKDPAKAKELGEKLAAATKERDAARTAFGQVVKKLAAAKLVEDEAKPDAVVAALDKALVKKPAEPAKVPADQLAKAREQAEARKWQAALREYVGGLLSLVPPADQDAMKKSLDESLRAAADARTSLYTPPEPTDAVKRAAADRLFSQGVSAYFLGDMATADARLKEAIELAPQDARFHYFLGLTKAALGQPAEAEFKAGAALEARGLPVPRVVSTSLERVQAGARAGLNKYRP